MGLDIVGPLTATPNGNKYLFVLVNYFTKWVEAKATKTIDANDVIEFLKDVFSRHGLPEVIITDNGRQFISDITKARVDLYGS
jgi:transposase-like protein